MVSEKESRYPSIGTDPLATRDTGPYRIITDYSRPIPNYSGGSQAQVAGPGKIDLDQATGIIKRKRDQLRERQEKTDQGVPGGARAPGKKRPPYRQPYRQPIDRQQKKRLAIK